MADRGVERVAATRRDQGKHAARALRARGGVPAVVYGHGEPVAVGLEARNAHAIQQMPRNHAFEIVTEGTKPELVRLVSSQRDPVSGHLLHLDFERLVRGERVHATVAVHLVGEEEVAKRDGVVTRLLDVLEIEGDPTRLPAAVTIDLSALAPGDHVLAGSVALERGVTLVTPAETAVVQVGHAQVTEVATPGGETPADAEAAAAKATEGEGES